MTPATSWSDARKSPCTCVAYHDKTIMLVHPHPSVAQLVLCHPDAIPTQRLCKDFTLAQYL